MNVSSLLSIIVIASLLAGGAACACEPVPDESSTDVHHEHHVLQDAPDAQCAHQDCDACVTLSSGCASLQVLTDHTGPLIRPLPFERVFEFDFPDQAPSFIDTGQLPVLAKSITQWGQTQPFILRAVDTPIQRKDQLNE